MEQNIVVIGAGVIGVSIGLELIRHGHKVTIVDKVGIAAGASQGNAGAFAFAEMLPLAAPGIMRKAPKWLLDPLSPLSVPPRYALQIIPWMLRFWRASRQDRYNTSIAAQSALMVLSKAALERQIANTQGEKLIRRDGQLQLYEGKKQFRDSLPGWEIRRRHGVDFELLQSPEAIAEIQPGLNRCLTHASFTPDWVNTVDPKTWVEHLARCFTQAGGRFERCCASALQADDTSVTVIHENGQIIADKLVVSAGAFSHHLARTLGERIPLETERGYNTTLPAGAFDLHTHLTFGNHGFVVSRVNEGVRVGGAVELGGLKLAPNFKRAEILLEKAARFLPGLNTSGGTQWMGFRPSLPDTLPVIGHSSTSKHVIYAFGHGHLGLTQSSATAELVCNMLGEQQAEISLEPYRAGRF